MNDIALTSHFVLRLVMMVFFAAGLGILLSPAYYRKAFESMFENKVTTYVTGIVALVVGFGIINFHNVWQGARVLITLFGWVALLKGLALIIFPERFTKASARFVKNANFYVYGIIAIVVGLVFGYFGYLV